MANGFEPTQLQQIGRSLQGISAGIAGELPAFQAQQNQQEALRQQQAQRQRQAQQAQQKQQSDIQKARAEDLFRGARIAKKFAKEDNFAPIIQMAATMAKESEQFPDADTSGIKRIAQLAFGASKKGNNQKEFKELLINELKTTEDNGVLAGFLEPIEEKERKIIKDVEGRQRFVDNQELVFPDVEVKEEEVKAPKITGPQRLAAAFAQRTTEAGDIISELGDEFTGFASRGAGLIPRGAQSEERQMFDQATKNFINATLRRESGAAIADSEFENANIQYIPQPGDGEEVLKQKQRNRETISKALELEAGEAFTQLSEALKDVSGTVKVMGKDMQVGTIVTNSKGQKRESRTRWLYHGAIMVAAEEFFSEETGQPIQVEPQSMSANDFFEGGEVETAQPETEEEKLNFATRYGEDIDKRVKMSGEIISAMESGEQSTAEGLLQLTGIVGAGAVWDFIGEGLVSGARGISSITPDIIKAPIKDAATFAAHEFLNTDVGKSALEIAQKGPLVWDIYKKKNPVAARNIEAVVNIGLLVIPAKAKKGAKPTLAEPTGLGKVAAKVEGAGIKQQAAQRTSFIDGLVRPKETAAVRAEQVGRTAEEGLFRKKVVELSPAEKAMATTIETVPEVTAAKTLQGNYNAISEEVGKEAGRLLAALEASPVKISRSEVNKSLDLAKQRLAQAPTIVGDAAKSAERLIAEAKNIVSKNPQTSAGLLKSRQQFDRFILSQKKGTVFDPALENATTLAVRDVRQTLNSLIDIKNPSEGVRQSLGRQSKLLSAMDDLAPKAAQEGSSIVSRAWQNAAKILPIRGEFNQTLATIFGIGGLGAAAKFAPIFTKAAALGIGSYAAGKFILGPQAKKGVSMLIKKMDQGIKIATDPDMVRQLRADRAAMIELIRISNGNTL